ncbi:MAG: hypothetical protein AAFQ40_00810 [Cyanobacteria bacterium J06623_5]
MNRSSSQARSAACNLCDTTLLQHIRKEGLRWYCPHCRQDTFSSVLPRHVRAKHRAKHRRAVSKLIPLRAAKEKKPA